ncbi:MAG: class I SAM-dependent methyltransferase [Vicinamibacterales bacterium]
MLSLANTPREELVARYSEVLRVLTPDGDATGLGDYLEFGVCFGYSLECMYAAADRHGLSQMRFFGFDSFEGLPDAARTDDGGYWSPRMFASDIRTTRRFLNKAGVDWNRVTLVKGWFSDSLNSDLMVRYSMRKASVIMIDCDMYLSAKQALDFCGPLIRDEAVIIFDDWYSGGLDEKNLGEKRAFETFLESGDFDAEPLWRYPPNAQVFRVRRLPRPIGTGASNPSAEG